MNILLIYPHLLHDKVAHGSGVRITRLIKELNLLGHKIFLLSIAESGVDVNSCDISNIKGMCREFTIVQRRKITLFTKIIFSIIPGTPPRVRSLIHPQAKQYVENITASGTIDIVYIVFTTLGDYIKSIDRDKCVVVLDADDLQTRRHQTRMHHELNIWRKLHAYYVFHKMRDYEKQLLNSVDNVVTISLEEAEFIRQLGNVISVSTIPPMIDTKHYYTSQQIPDNNNLLFVGSFSNPPNVDAVIWFCLEAFPKVCEIIPNVHLYIVGNHSIEKVGFLSNANISVVGYVDDLREWIEKASVTINPVRFGGGVRMKNLETLALGRPLVSTKLGAEGLGGFPESDGYLLADDALHFSKNIISLLNERDYLHQMGKAGRSMVKKYHDTTIISSRIEEYLESILAGRMNNN